MARDIVITGETLLKVKGYGALLDVFDKASLKELGLASEEIRISPRIYHQDIRTNDFGPLPVNNLFMGAECFIDMTLIHWDFDVLQQCIANSMTINSDVLANNNEGTLPPFGSLMNNTLYKNLPPDAQPFSSGFMGTGWNYISLNIVVTSGQLPWRFPVAYLTGQPIEIPLGTKAMALGLRWRAIPLPQLGGRTIEMLGGENVALSASGWIEIVSSGSILWSHTLDD